MSFWNPYLREIGKLRDKRFNENHRRRLRRRYGYICPTSAAIRLLLAERNGIVELMAGSGYFMEVLRRAADRELRQRLWASDRHPPRRGLFLANAGSWDKQWFAGLRPGDQFSFPAEITGEPKPTLLIVWPFLNSTDDALAVERFMKLGGKRLALVTAFEMVSGSIALQHLVNSYWKEIASAVTFSCGECVPTPRLRLYERVVD